MAIFDKVQEIIVKELKVDAAKVTLEASLKDDLGADSLDAVEIVMDIEDEFGVEIDDTKAEAISTVGDLVAYIEELTK
ncbi:MAG: acyl carrier protein [Anaeroplasmataceae bacterium]|nr:acyl carrier protein [Anaeroplasma bactoclasticum]MCM1196054.1 acyl carrier protein [Roseburia sp.]MCM1556739.1 acyl carrier protein [Anaeroplasma bactoclasticum]MDE6661184.1 acyl carrier protein [Anaeroplasmataceae bacterium]MDE7106153.1 acyl carrier protein [Anaeroplasmataceae bacterium]